MKIAICISGHLRTFELCHQSLKRNVLDKYDCDVFVSTWNNIGNTLYHAHYKPGFDEVDDRINVNRIIEVYKPVDMLIEDSSADEIKNIKKPFSGLKTRNGADVYQVVPMFYKMWNCNNLKKAYEEKNGFKYDITVKCRPDLYIHSINMEMATQKIQFIPGHCGFNDIIFVGPSNHMTDVFELYPLLSPNLPFGMFENAENIMHEHIINNNIPHEISAAVDYWFIKPAGVFDSRGQKVGELNNLPP
jgi:hypothetical protein